MMSGLSKLEVKVLAAFSAAVLVIFGLGATAWWMVKEGEKATGWIAHAHEVLGLLAVIEGQSLQVELSAQNFRISGDPQRLVERDAAIAERELVLTKLRQRTVDDPSQQQRWLQLREVLDQRMAIAKRAEFLRKTASPEVANAFIASAPLNATRERARQILEEMQLDERNRLQAQIAEQLRARQTVIHTGGLVGVLLVALLTATFFLMRRQLRETEASRRALADNEQRLSITLHSIGDAVLATDTAGRITNMNRVAEQMTGWTLEDARGRPVDEVFRIVNEETRKPAEIPVAKVLATGKIQGLANHTVLIARGGNECPIADSAAPITDAQGEVSGVVLVFRDVTVEQLAQRTIRDQNALLEQRVLQRTSQLQASEDHLQSLIGNVPALIAYVDAQQRYVYVNDQYRLRFAPEHADISGLTVREILGEQRYAIAGPLIARVLLGESQAYDWQPFPGVWQRSAMVPQRDTSGRISGYYLMSTDITDRKESEEKIHLLNAELEVRIRMLEQVSRALKTLSAGNRVMLRAETEREMLDTMCSVIVGAGGYRMASVWFREDDEHKSLIPVALQGDESGVEALKALRKTWADNELGRGVIATAVRTGQSSVVHNILTDPSYEPWRAHLRGCESGVACPLLIHGEIIGALAIYAAERDVFREDEVALLTELADDLAFGIATLRAHDEQKKIQDTIVHMTHFDALTGLPNELQFTEILGTTIRWGAAGTPAALVQINIERLGEINLALGFSQGDQILREFGERLKATVPASATVARLRGDEFAVLLPRSGRQAAMVVAQRLRAMLDQPFPIADLMLDISASVGVALYPEHGLTAHDLFRHMDMAVHQAKKKGVGYVVFDSSNNQDQSHRLTMAGELRRAIEGGDLLLHLQPKVEMGTGRVWGAEGLVRWKHAQRGLIPPFEFIGLAEHTGLIKPLTEWVITTALKLNHDWERRARGLPIAINLSARNLRDEGLVDKVSQLLRTWGVATGALEVEITESLVMEDPEFSLRVLRSLRDLGIALYIDDFGTGYSSLSYLQQLPVDSIKIDQSFIRDMSVSKDSTVIVRSTIDLAHDLGRRVVAEGVETQAQWDQLAAFGCDMAQGYFIAKPMPAEDFQHWLGQFQPPVTNN